MGANETKNLGMSLATTSGVASSNSEKVFTSMQARSHPLFMDDQSRSLIGLRLP